MSTMETPAKPDVMKFEDWYTENRDLVDTLDEVDCLECEGTGEAECGECGHTGDCDDCDGYGWQPYASMTNRLRQIKRSGMNILNF